MIFTPIHVQVRLDPGRQPLLARGLPLRILHATPIPPLHLRRLRRHPPPHCAHLRPHSHVFAEAEGALPTQVGNISITHICIQCFIVSYNLLQYIVALAYKN
jgi:hypothetical protein